MTEAEENTPVQAQQQEDVPEYKGQSLDSSKLQDRTYKGEDYNCDVALQHGCVVKRRCSDVLCMITFLVFLSGMIFVTFWGYVNGEIEVSMAPINAEGGFCGYDYTVVNSANTNKGYPYLYIYNPVDAYNAAADDGKLLWQYGLCVEKCPTSKDLTINCSDQSKLTDPNCGQSSAYATKSSFNYCYLDTSSSDVSDDQINAWNAFINTYKYSAGGSFMMDVYREKWVILMGIGFTLVYTLIYIKFMDKCAFCLSWFSVIIIQVALVGLGLGVFYWGKDLSETSQSNSTWCNFIAWTCWIFAGFYCLCLVCNFRSLRISFAVIETAGDYFSQTKRILLVPILFFIVAIIFYFMWLFGLVCVATNGVVYATPYATNGVTYYSQQRYIINDGDVNGWLIFYMFFGFIWISFFLIACNDFVIIVSTITWYFSRKTDHGEEGQSSVWTGFHWIYRYNLGTLAVGSLILSVVWIIRGFFEYIGEKLVGKESENGCARCLLSCCKCCISCTDRFIRYLTENAYIYAAISGDSFCTSALHSFMLMLKNAAKFSFVSSVANVFMYLAKISISFCSVLTCWGIMSAMTNSVTELDNSFGPLLVIFLISYLTTAIFMSIFHTSANTILQCFIVDRDIAIQKGHVDAQHVPNSLLKFIDEYCKDNNIDKDEEKPAEQQKPAEQEQLISEENTNSIS